MPKGLSATHVVQAIRNKFFDGYKEAEFLCVCDTLKENPKVLEELNDAQVSLCIFLIKILLSFSGFYGRYAS